MRMPFLNKPALFVFFTFAACVSLSAQESLGSDPKSLCATSVSSASLWLTDCGQLKTAETQRAQSLNREVDVDDLQQPNSQDPAKVPKDTYVFPTSKKRFDRYARSTVGPFSLLRNAASAGIDHWSDSPEEWEQGATGYGKRFASNFARNAIRQTVTYGLSEALRQDTGFERSKRKGFWPRLSDALVQNVTSRTRSGKRVISAPLIAGAYASSLIAVEAWYPERYSYKDALRSGTYSLATGFAINIVREFVYNW
jgi:hypothetical protein